MNKEMLKGIISGSALVALLSLTLCGRALASPSLELCIDGTSCVVETPAFTTAGPPATSGYVDLSLPDGWTIFASLVPSNSPSLGLTLGNFGVECLSSSCLGSTNSLDIVASAVGFTPLVGLGTTFSVTQSSMTSEQLSYFDTSNTLFGEGTEIGKIGPTSSSSFSGSAAGGGAPGTRPYSLTIDDIFDASAVAASATTLGAIDPTPEPRSMLLMGTGLLLMAGIIRRLRRTQKTA